MTRDEFLKVLKEFDGSNGKVKGYEEFKPKKTDKKPKGPPVPSHMKEEKKEEEEKKVLSYEDFKKKEGNGDKPTPPAGGAALPRPKAAMKHEEFKSFSEWLSIRNP